MQTAGALEVSRQAPLIAPTMTAKCSPVPWQVRRVIIERAVSQVFSVALRDLEKQTRGKKDVAFARQVAMYLAHVTCGLNLTETGSLFHRDRTTVAHACSVVEDRRDEPTFDLALYFLEQSVRNLLGACFPDIQGQGVSGV